MIILTVGILCAITGIMLFFLAKIMPIFQMIYLDWIGLSFVFLPFIIVMYFLINDDMYLWVESISKWKHRIAYMRRDNRIIPMTGRRIYASESFLENTDLGLIEFLGKDCVFSWGKKKVVLALENLNYTPDPRYASFTYMLYELGFSCPQDVVDVLEGKDLELMAKVWVNMQLWHTGHGVKKLVYDLKNYKGENFNFKERVDTKSKEKISERVDEILGKVSYVKYDKGY